MKILAIKCHDTVDVPGPDTKSLDVTSTVGGGRHKGVTLEESTYGVLLRNGRSTHLVPWSTVRTVVYEQAPEAEEAPTVAATPMAKGTKA